MNKQWVQKKKEATIHAKRLGRADAPPKIVVLISSFWKYP
jgi:hypothetical protein